MGKFFILIYLFMTSVFLYVECSADETVFLETVENRVANWQVPCNSLPEDFQYEIQSMGYYGHKRSPQLASDLWNYLLYVRGIDCLKDVSAVFICIDVDRHQKVKLRVDSPLDHPKFTWR